MIKLSNPPKQDNSLWLKVKHTHMSGSDVKYLYLGKLIFLGISDFSQFEKVHYQSEIINITED